MTIINKRKRLAALRTIPPMRSRVRLVSRVLGAAVISGLLFGCGSDERTAEVQVVDKVRIALTTLPGSSGVFIADELGFFKDEGLEVSTRIFDTGQQAMLEMISGGAEFATVGDTPLARAAVEGKEVSVVAEIGENSYGNLILARSDRGIREVQDLKQKRIGRVPWTTADFFLHAYLTTSHIDPAEVEVVDLRPTDIPAALVRGEVDAVSTWPPYVTMGTGSLGTNAVLLHDPSVYTMKWTVTVRPEWGTVEGRAVRKFLRGMLRASEFIRSNPEESRAIYGKRAKLDKGAVDQAWRGWEFSLALDQSLILDLEDQARWILRRRSGKQSPPNFLRFVNSEALEAVHPDLVSIPGR